MMTWPAQKLVAVTIAMLTLSTRATAACARLCRAWPRPTPQPSLRAAAGHLSHYSP